MQFQDFRPADLVYPAPSRPAPARFMTTKWVVRKSCGSDYVRKASLPARLICRFLFWRFFSFVRNWPDFERYGISPHLRWAEIKPVRVDSAERF